MKNILFNTEMTKAILDGHKVQTRRVIKTDKLREIKGIEDNKLKVSRNYRVMIENYKIPLEKIIEHFSKYQIGETIWVREPARVKNILNRPRVENSEILFEYLADNKVHKIALLERLEKENGYPKWLRNRQGIPNGCIVEMARIFLRITNVKVERLRDMSYGDLRREGIWNESNDTRMPISQQRWNIRKALWNKTAPKGFKWEDNPYVFVYEFERVERDGSK